jgi:hypothetical protein
MPKTFYTEKDIEDLFNRGTKVLRLDENVALTELAYEKAKRLGIQLLTTIPDNPPSAPVRPYLSQSVTPPSTVTAASVASALSNSVEGQPRSDGLANRIRAAVIKQLGNQVQPQLLDKIIQRVLKSTGLG